MRKYWWKIICVIALYISLIAGLMIPLKPGISNLDSDAKKAGGTVSINIEGYNTRFLSAPEKIRAWLTLDSPAAGNLLKDTTLRGNTYKPVLAAGKITVADNRHITATFDLPPFLPGKTKRQVARLITDDPANGLIIALKPVFLVQDSIDQAGAVTFWSKDKISATHHFDSLSFPYLKMVFESIRNMFYHVPMWFAMLLLMLLSTIYAILYLNKQEKRFDHWSDAFARAGTLLGFLGLITGAVWARYTWGQFWSFDDKQITAAIALFIYLAYFVLRMSMDDPEKEAKLAAVYNIFAFATLIPLLFIIPRLSASSNHPGSQGNPAFGQGDMDVNMKWIFWLAVLGWLLMGIWISELVYRFNRVKDKFYYK